MKDLDGSGRPSPCAEDSAPDSCRNCRWAWWLQHIDGGPISGYCKFPIPLPRPVFIGEPSINHDHPYQDCRVWAPKAGLPAPTPSEGEGPK
jgi:hypothetical protein